jgi:hypothetical protein
MGKYCSESADYDLGGLCVDSSMMDESVHRELYVNDGAETHTQFCDPSSPYFGYFDCDCTEFDVATGVGDISCALESNYCIDYANTTCLDFNVYGSFSGNGTYTISNCYTFVSPSEETVCYSSNRPAPNGCEISFNGETCNACSETLYTDYFGDANLCYQFDCTNTEGMNEGNTCEGDIISKVFQEFFDNYGPYGDEFLCEICGTNNIVTNPDGVVSLPGQPTFTCSEISAAAEMGNITETDCGLIQPFITAPCKCTGESDIFVCSICADGEVMGNPDGIVSIPTQPHMTCAELFTAAEEGLISELQCPLVGPFVGACECMEYM